MIYIKKVHSLFSVVFLCFSCFFISLVISGCSIEKSTEELFGANTPDKFSEPEHIEAKDAVFGDNKKDFSESENPQEVDDSFVSNYVDKDSLDDIEDNVDIAIKAVNNEAGYTEKEVALMKELFSHKAITMKACTDVSEKQAEMNKALKELAEASNQTIENYLKNNYDMTINEFNDFTARKAQEFVTKE